MKIADIVQAAQDQLGISDLDSWTDEAQLTRWAVLAIRTLEARADWVWMEENADRVFLTSLDDGGAASTVINGIDVPARRIIDVTYGDRVLERRPHADIRMLASATADHPLYFAPYRSPSSPREMRIAIAPRPVADVFSVRVRMVVPSPFEFPAFDETVAGLGLRIPDEFLQVLVEHVCYVAWRNRGRLEDSGAALAAYERIVEAMLALPDMVLEDGSYSGSDRDRDRQSRAGGIG